MNCTYRSDEQFEVVDEFLGRIGIILLWCKEQNTLVRAKGMESKSGEYFLSLQ